MPGKGTAMITPAEGCIDEREAKFLENRLVHRMTQGEAVLAAGYDMKLSSAKVFGHHLEKRHRDSNSLLLQSFEAVGINPQTIAEKVKAGMNSKTFVKRKVDKDTEELVEVEDNHAQHKFVETALDVMGAKAPKKIEIEQKTFEQRLLEITMRKEG